VVDTLENIQNVSTSSTLTSVVAAISNRDRHPALLLLLRCFNTALRARGVKSSAVNTSGVIVASSSLS
jgi:hypothetical protein